jgi:geranylgeranyl pyrophosphate synthase
MGLAGGHSSCANEQKILESVGFIKQSLGLLFQIQDNVDAVAIGM